MQILAEFDLQIQDCNKELRSYLMVNFISQHDIYTNTISLRTYWAFERLEFRLSSTNRTFFVTGLTTDRKYARFDIGVLESNFFSNIYNPTDNELVFFELTYGFEWPFCEKNKKEHKE